MRFADFESISSERSRSFEILVNPSIAANEDKPLWLRKLGASMSDISDLFERIPKKRRQECDKNRPKARQIQKENDRGIDAEHLWNIWWSFLRLEPTFWDWIDPFGFFRFFLPNEISVKIKTTSGEWWAKRVSVRAKKKSRISVKNSGKMRGPGVGKRRFFY